MEEFTASMAFHFLQTWLELGPSFLTGKYRQKIAFLLPPLSFHKSLCLLQSERTLFGGLTLKTHQKQATHYANMCSIKGNSILQGNGNIFYRALIGGCLRLLRGLRQYIKTQRKTAVEIQANICDMQMHYIPAQLHWLFFAYVCV